jgi:hypothetical protein
LIVTIQLFLDSTRSRTPGITRREESMQASNLADDIHALSGRVHADVRLPAIESIQLALTTATGIIQRPPCDVQNRRKRGGET